jgi:hypothetical protein
MHDLQDLELQLIRFFRKMSTESKDMLFCFAEKRFNKEKPSLRLVQKLSDTSPTSTMTRREVDN